MVSSWVGSTIPWVRLGQRMHTTLHAAVVSYRQVGLIVTSKLASAGRIVTDNYAPTKTPWTKNPESNRIAEVGSQGRSMTWGESLQCRMVRVGVSQCRTGGWRKRQGTVVLDLLANTAYMGMDEDGLLVPAIKGTVSPA
jgi:hypothetical protein